MSELHSFSHSRLNTIDGSIRRCSSSCSALIQDACGPSSRHNSPESGSGGGGEPRASRMTSQRPTLLTTGVEPFDDSVAGNVGAASGATQNPIASPATTPATTSSNIFNMAITYSIHRPGFE